MARKIKTLLPWLAAAAIFAYMFHLYPPGQVWGAMQYVHFTAFIPFAVAYLLVIYFADVFSMRVFLKRFGFSVPLSSLIPGRGATYLMSVVNYGAGQAGFAYYLKRTHDIPIGRALSIFFFIAVIDLFWIVSLVFLGSFMQEYKIGDVEFRPFVRTAAAIVYCLFFGNILFWRGGIYKKLRDTRWKPLQWFLKRDIFTIFRQAGFLDYFYLVLLRTPIHVTIIISMYVVLLTFEVFCPFERILGTIPLVYFVGTIPITPGGIGTTNAVMVELLHPYTTGKIFASGKTGPAQLLFAASLLWMFANYAIKILIGLVCLKRVSRELFKAPPQAAEKAAHIAQNLPV